MPKQSLLGDYLGGPPQHGKIIFPRTPILTRQSRLQIATLSEYLNDLEENTPIRSILLYQDDKGQFWHMDGLHRIMAHRIYNRPIKASIWMPGEGR